MAINIEKIREKSKELREELRKDRIARGLPPEPPDKFVPVPVSTVLFKEVKKSFLPIATKYANIIAGGGFVRIDTQSLAKYRETAELLSMSLGVTLSTAGAGVIATIRLMDDINRHIDKETTDQIDLSSVMLRLKIFLKLINQPDDADYVDVLNDDVNYNDQYKASSDEVKRLESDPDALAAEIKKARDHYESIKHLL